MATHIVSSFAGAGRLAPVVAAAPAPWFPVSVEGAGRLDTAVAPPFPASDLLGITTRYVAGQAGWGDSRLLGALVSANAAVVIPVAQEVGVMSASLVCVVGTGASSQAWVLRMVLAPDFVWLGLAPTQLSVEQACSPAGVDSTRHIPLTAVGVFNSTLPLEESWTQLLVALRQHSPAVQETGVAPQDVTMAEGSGHPEDIDMDRPFTPVAVSFSDSQIPTCFDLSRAAAIAQPTKSRRDWRSGNSVETELDKPKERSDPARTWVGGDCSGYNTSTWRPNAGVGTSSAPKRNGVIPFNMG
ncbi:hypothetical protein N7466_010122 [Penicillium verhagenii]|uniref:uncharacterized protein n=1 Tax=Penicillium verhagenii TaxID=1562060 RepID=UPI002545849F|nr:uncharacterized protein N7466_010122 [Penicillium verhagenii]KAJ5919179.1 hypothetical protein N7466_010122 [Penicillium verhagenii]